MNPNSDTLTKYKEAAQTSVIFFAIDKVGDVYDKTGLTKAIENGFIWYYQKKQ